MNMFDILNQFHNEEFIQDFKSFAIPFRVPNRTVIFREGQVDTNIYFINKGCLRLYYYKDDKDFTVQFFTENQAYIPYMTINYNTPSNYYLESLEPTNMVYLRKQSNDYLLKKYDFYREYEMDYLLRTLDESQRKIIEIKDFTPPERYQNFLKYRPGLIDRVPHHMIASYLGITNVSLSRIRSRKNTDDIEEIFVPIEED